MPDFPENTEPLDPVASARRGARAPLRRRFYAHAKALGTSTGFGVSLDDKPIHTPKARPLVAPTLALAEAIAAEWQAQQDQIDPATMPLTRLANAIIDGVAEMPGEVRAEIEKYLGTDLLFYRADSPEKLRQLQARHWDPVLDWAREALAADFKLGQGVVHVTQPQAAREAAAAAIPNDPWLLGAVNVITTLTGSALLALAMLRGQLSAEQAWQAAHVDEDWNMEQWGRDEMSLDRRAFRLAEFQAAAKILSNAAQPQAT
jgi:chaperone required for assembly of F1-ATPase